MATPTFYLGTHEPSWLARTDVPLFLSHRRLHQRRTFPRARGRWALDSGGFSELQLHGRWETRPAAYIDAVRRYRDQIGNLDWAAPQDWMCEPHMLARTGLTIDEHQARTVDSYLELSAAAPDLPWIPVLQGWQLADYRRCAERYRTAGVDLEDAIVVGVGSVCRRQHSNEIARIMSSLAADGLALHGFGVKTAGLAHYGQTLTSADSLAWSYAARYDPPLTGHTHASCANCLDYALQWRERVTATLARAATSYQPPLDLAS